jgi:hypothetical protein
VRLNIAAGNPLGTLNRPVKHPFIGIGSRQTGDVWPGKKAAGNARRLGNAMD